MMSTPPSGLEPPRSDPSSFPSPHIPQASIRHPLTQPLSPDLPTQDALYLFSNFSSYMRSPREGAEGINNSEDFKDTVRLLDFARVRAMPILVFCLGDQTDPKVQSMANQPQSNVHILHLKYRFHSKSQAFQSHYSTGDDHLTFNIQVGNPVRQPFSVFQDPVIKIDYRLSQYLPLTLADSRNRG